VNKLIAEQTNRDGLRNHPGPFFILIYAAVFLVLLFNFAIADNLSLSHADFRNDSLIIEIEFSDSLPEALLTQIDKGVPVAFKYSVELWYIRGGWFDELTGKAEIDYRLRYDTWERKYTLIRQTEEITIEHRLRKLREVMELISTTDELPFNLGNQNREYYLRGKLTILTMSLSNLREIESWLKGGLRDPKSTPIEEAPSKLGDFIFNTALKLSGIKNLVYDLKTEPFSPGDSIRIEK
jgi:hypothetical protein